MSDLKTCPFCKGEASMRLFYKGKYRVHCNICDAHSGDVCDTEAEAIATWNTRAERTCHIIKASRKYVLSDGTELFEDGCSVCNGYLSDEDNYCSNCGAKVVGE